jgi:tetratricopeptide (TPR) repeat protein
MHETGKPFFSFRFVVYSVCFDRVIRWTFMSIASRFCPTSPAHVSIPVSPILFLALLVPCSSSITAQTAVCPARPAHQDTPADAAYRDSDFPKAEQLYTEALAQDPNSIAITSSLVHTLLEEDHVTQASERAQAMLAADPHSALSLTAEAEVELRLGHPWRTVELLDQAENADHCDPRIHLIRSRALHIDSMYASERKEIQKAYEIDPSDPDIAKTWNGIISPTQEIEGTEQALGTMKDLDDETRHKAEKTVSDLLPLLSENSQTCKVLPTIPSATLPLLPSREDGRNIDGFRIDAQLGKSRVKLELDTAASGVYITRELAQENGLNQGANDPQGTVRLDSLKVGPLEFRDCLVGVSDTPFPGKADGYIGTDIFASYLVGIDPRAERLTLDPLPKLTSVVPGDRPSVPELAGFTPVYHRRQYLLVPVTLNGKSRSLMVFDTGMRFSTMRPDIAHSISNMKVNFTNTFQTTSGPPQHVYRDTFDFQFANLAMNHLGHILEFEPAAIDHNAGFEVGGLLGFDILRQLALELDYRDGLVRIDTANGEQAPLKVRELADNAAPSAPSSLPTLATSPSTATTDSTDSSCPRDSDARPIKATVEATVQIAMDSGHAKPGKEVWAKTVNPYAFPGCTLIRDSIVYGRVVEASSRKNSGSAELVLAFDRGECQGRGKQQISLRLIGIVAPPPNSAHLHEMIPTEVAGQARQISDSVGVTGGYDPQPIQKLVPSIVHPGVVVGMPQVKLDPAGGPGCSARISSSGRSVQLDSGVELILAAYGIAAK